MTPAAPAPGDGGEGGARPVPIRFQVAARSVWTATRRMRQLRFDLADLLSGRECRPPALGEDEDGVDLRSIPQACADRLGGASGGLIALPRQRYPRHFVRLRGTFDDYARGFSGRNRSTLNRKRRRWAEASGGIDVRDYHRPDEVAAFARIAGALSARTYQSRLLGAGLPVDDAALAAMRARAGRGAMRAFVLFHRDRPAAFLHLPARGDALLYAHLGYEPDLAALSPGTVLQWAALERLFGEGAFGLFDFTEGDGAHKRLFGRESVACADLMLLRPGWRNRLLAASLPRFDRLVADAAAGAAAGGIKPALRRLLRR